MNLLRSVCICLTVVDTAAVEVFEAVLDTSGTNQSIGCKDSDCLPNLIFYCSLKNCILLTFSKLFLKLVETFLEGKILL